jgi:AcrR family transcriptional regulator
MDAMATADTAQRRRGRPKAEDAMPLEYILQAALTAFATYGYDGVSLRTLNREVGVSHNLINQRFGTKEDLWRAAVDYGYGNLAEHIRGSFDPTLTDPLEQLRLAAREFLMFSASHPELLSLLNIEACQDTDRLDYIYRTYIEPATQPFERLLKHLAANGVIRPIPIRTLHFLMAHGGAAPFSLVPLATKFDRTSPLKPKSVKAHADLVSRLLIEGLRLRPADGETQ